MADINKDIDYQPVALKFEYKFNKRELLLNAIFFFITVTLSFFISFYLVPLSRDYQNYESYYFALSKTANFFDDDRYEFGFQFIARVISFVFPKDIKVLYFVIITISLYIKYLLLLHFSNKKFANTALFFFFYLISFLLVFEANQIRAAIAISFGFASLYVFNKKRTFLSLLFLVLAFSFHYSAIVFVLGHFSIFMVKKKKTKLLFILIIAGCIVSGGLVSFMEALNPMAFEYHQNYDEVNFGITSFTFLFPFLFFLFNFLNIKNENDISTALLMFLFAGLLFSIVMRSIPVYAIRILELMEVGVLFIAADRKYNSYYNFGLGIITFLIIFHKFIAYVFVNSLFYF